MLDSLQVSFIEQTLILKVDLLQTEKVYECIAWNMVSLWISSGWAWLVQLVRSLPSDHKVPSSILGSAKI